MKARQRIRYVRAEDGTRLAWAQAGTGQPLVKAANWLTHLEYDWTSPVWRHWIEFLSGQFQLTRYDERGCGMSEWRTRALTIDEWTADLDLVITAAGIDAPVTLLGISQGAAACIQYAIRRPERVARMILYGGYAQGAFKRGNQSAERAYRAMVELARVSWGASNPTFRQVFTSRFIPGGTAEQLQWFNELCIKCTTGEVAGELLEARAALDVVDLLPQVCTPTLVLHARDDQVVPFSEGQRLAAEIKGAEFVQLDSGNHVLLEHEPAWGRFKQEVIAFAKGQTLTDVFSALSLREREVLTLLARGFSNARIAQELRIGEKTVRNHASNLFDKLGVRSRAEAIVYAGEHGFGR
jgi:pimeloyl-ACP methyl ester carboxylesterase/DNA-binding CsgD family transcriptional regulator